MSTQNNPDKKQDDGKMETSNGGDFDAEEYELRKVLPPRLPLRPNDVYVTTKTNFPAQLAKCNKLIESGHEEIFVHGLGAAVNRAINLSLQIKRQYAGSMDLATSTSSVKVTDRLIPLLDDLAPRSNVRFVSAVHIKIFRPEAPLPPSL